MAIQYSGNLLVKVRNRPFAGLLAGPQPLAIPGYRLAPLFKAHHATAMFAAAQPADHWLTATASAGSDLHPWDEAHRVARSAQYSIYVEPDLLQEAPEAPVAPEAAAQQGFDQDWPPASLVSPGWHLAEGFTGFEKVRAMATGTGVRIAHLDTGYWPPQVSTPRHIRRDLGYNFYENNTNTTDPGTGGLLRNPGHGTATLAIVSGNTVDLIYQGKQYTGDFGGAPDAEVVPVRIGPSVVHFFSSAMALGHGLRSGSLRATRRTATRPTNAMSSRSATADCRPRAGPMRSITSTRLASWSWRLRVTISRSSRPISPSIPAPSIGWSPRLAPPMTRPLTSPERSASCKATGDPTM